MQLSLNYRFERKVLNDIFEKKKTSQTRLFTEV